MPIVHHDLFTILKCLLISGLLCVFLGIAAVNIEWRNTGALLFLVAAFILIALYFFYEKYKDYKNIYLEFLPQDQVNDMLNHGTYEFTNHQLIYSSKKVRQKVSWSELLNYDVVNKKHIVLFRKDNTQGNLILSETEMSKSDFIIAIEFINERVKKTTYNKLHSN